VQELANNQPPKNNSHETSSNFPDNISFEIKEKISQETERLKNLPSTSLEHQTVKEYLNWLQKLPWNKFSYQEPDLKNFKSILNESHYGLDQVKECILEHMTIEKLSNNSRGTIICFVGPPGTGKTSIAKAIAKATNRKIIKIALGGMSDEAELRGHRRTYVASRPGRIIAGLKSCQTFDPLILLDEIDKLDSYRGNAGNALLEILDPEQNNEFIDRYMEVPIDLSKVLFICTANYENKIPPALKDRFEIIEFREYNQKEKNIIVEKFLIPEIMQDYSITDLDINFEDDSLVRICLQAGIRDIKRTIQKLLRKAAVKITVENETSVKITQKDVDSILNNKSNGSRKVGF
jgi:ATP-dependent Lon protease